MKKVPKLLISKNQAAFMLDCAYEKIDSLIRNNELRLFSDRNNGLNRDKIYLGDIENYIERKLQEYQDKQVPISPNVISSTELMKSIIRSTLGNSADKQTYKNHKNSNS